MKIPDDFNARLRSSLAEWRRSRKPLALVQIGTTAKTDREKQHVLPVLAEALRDEDEDVRLAAAEALGHIGPAAVGVAGALAELLLGSEERARHIAGEALRKIGGPAGVLDSGTDLGHDPAEEASSRGEVTGERDQDQQETSAKATAGVVLDPLAAIAAINRRITEALVPEVEAFREVLRRLEGQDFGSLEANHKVAEAIQSTCERLGVRIVCPQEGCGEQSWLRCISAGRTRHGSFQFLHKVAGRLTVHCGRRKLPALEVEPVAEKPHEGIDNTRNR